MQIWTLNNSLTIKKNGKCLHRLLLLLLLPKKSAQYQLIQKSIKFTKKDISLFFILNKIFISAEFVHLAIPACVKVMKVDIFFIQLHFFFYFFFFTKGLAPNYIFSEKLRLIVAKVTWYNKIMFISWNSAYTSYSILIHPINTNKQPRQCWIRKFNHFHNLHIVSKTTLSLQKVSDNTPLLFQTIRTSKSSQLCRKTFPPSTKVKKQLRTAESL